MAEIKDPENTILVTLKGGEVAIELLKDIAPLHAERMKTLARAKAYDNVCFHRVIDGFMAQTGDVENGNMENNFNLKRAGTGGSEMPDVRQSFRESRMIAAPLGLHGRRTPIRPTANSSSISRTTTS